LPSETHWFCPIAPEHEANDYFDEDIDPADPVDDAILLDRRTAMERYEARKRTVFQALHIFSYEGGANLDVLHTQVKDRISEQLQSCHVCVREYHGFRAELHEELQSQYPETVVAIFMQRFDAFNNNRIKINLDHCTNQLLRLPENRRLFKNLDDTAPFTFLEAMCSPVFIQDEMLMSEHFDKPFEMMETLKHQRLMIYVPSHTEFLFSSVPIRKQWAWKEWMSKNLRKPTRRDFDRAMRDPLLRALYRVQMTSLDLTFLADFWKGMSVIVSRLDEDLITHCLRGLDVDVFRLTLEHLHVSIAAATFIDLMATVSRVLKLAPRAYWDSMLTINPPTVIEQIFQSTSMPLILREPDSPDLEGAFQWVDPFLASLSPANMPLACRSLVQHLMDVRQDKAFPLTTRSHCFELAMKAISSSSQSLVDARMKTDPSCVGEMISVIKRYSKDIISQAKGHKIMVSGDIPTALPVVRRIVELESYLLVTGHRLISQKKALGKHQFVFLGSGLLAGILESVESFDVALAAQVLIGARSLALVDRFPARNVIPDGQSFNAAFEKTTKHVADLLEKVNDFAARDISSFFKTEELASGVLTYLFIADAPCRIHAAQILKTWNTEGGPGRRDALASILQQSYLTTIKALTWAISQISQARPPLYHPLASVVQISSDVIDALCSSEDGILRSRDFTEEECNATTALWETIWQALTVIFQSTEGWSLGGHDTGELKEFCRDVMQFAYDLFMYHKVLAGALAEENAPPEQKRNLASSLLQHPNTAMNGMAQWLRLRDEFLANKIVGLVCELLVKLKEASLQIAENAQDFLERILAGVVRAKLSEQQKAAISRAFDTHVGVTREQRQAAQKQPERAKAKQQTIKSWVSSGSSTPNRRDATPRHSDSDSVSEGMAKVMKGTTKAADAYKTLVKQKAATVLRQKSAADDAFMRERLAHLEAAKKKKAEIIAKAKNLRAELTEGGSGLNKLRVTATDHATKVTGIMVSSESEDSDDELDKELFGSTVKLQKSRMARPDSRIKMVADTSKGPTKIRRLVRSAKDMRARLAPDMASLHKIILSWDYFHEGDLPPSGVTNYQRLPPSFQSPYDYKLIFEPLLLLEAWQGFVKSREEINSKPFDIKVASRATVDSFYEVSSVQAHTENREVYEGDVVLLSLIKNPSSVDKKSCCLSRVWKVARKKQGLEIIYRIMPEFDIGRQLNRDREIFGLKIQSLTTLEREYGALQSLQYYDLSNYILRAQPSHLLEYNDRQLEPLIKTYEVNKAQAKAVKSAVDNDAFTLIQGPPGSGKTKTIVAIVGALLTDSLKVQGTAIKVPGAANDVQPMTRKLLVCAPSNAAVDELVIRLKNGVRTLSGELKKINVVRLGRSDAINAAVQDVTLEELVNARLGHGSNRMEEQRQETSQLMKEHQKVSQDLRLAREKFDTENTKETKAAFDELRQRKAALGNSIDVARDREKNVGRRAELERKHHQQAVLDDSHVICATLSGSGHEMFQNLNIEFETVIIDEAAQCVEASALIPLKYGCAKCILVGDPKQLPPTVLSKVAASEYQYEQSLFVRMQTNYPDDVHLLDTQYRMHPEISRFPSETFYDGRLLDGPNMAGLRTQPWHGASLLGPYRFFDVKGQHQYAPKGHSLINVAECEVALQLHDRLVNDFPDVDFRTDVKIGIITPYKSQLSELKMRFSRRHGQGILGSVEFNTTDAFQGRECDIIIFSCVRASPSGNIGFLQDIRRMNVGLTRAKSSLWVLGNSESLMRGEFWAKLIENAKARKCFSQGGFVKELQTAAPRAKLPMSKPRPEKHGAQRTAELRNDPKARGPERSAPAPSPATPVTIPKPKDIDMPDAPGTVGEKPPTAAPRIPPPGGMFGGGRPPAPQVVRRVKRPPANPLLPPSRPKKPRE
jgi:senataxin